LEAQNTPRKRGRQAWGETGREGEGRRGEEGEGRRGEEEMGLEELRKQAFGVPSL